MTLDQIDDIELLRKAALLLQEDNKKLVSLIAKMKKELHALRGGDPEQLKLAIADLEQQLSKRNQMLFGDKSEKRSRADEQKAEKASQSGHGPRQQPLLPEIEQVHLLDEADQVCSSCGGSLKIWKDQHEASEEIDVVELKYVLKKHLRQKYRCGCGACIETAHCDNRRALRCREARQHRSTRGTGATAKRRIEIDREAHRAMGARRALAPRQRSAQCDRIHGAHVE